MLKRLGIYNGPAVNLCNENLLLEMVLQRILPDTVSPGDAFSPGKVRVVLADCNYDDKSWSLDAVMVWVRRHLAKSKEPVMIVGYDKEETVRKRAEGSLLDVSGVAYIRLPLKLDKIRMTVNDLRHLKPEELDSRSVKRNVEEFQKELRSDFCHGAFGSIQRNIKGTVTRFNEKRYTDAVKQLMINLESYGRAKASLERIKSAFPLNHAPFNSTSDMLSMIEKIEHQTRKAIVLLESNPG